MKLYNWLVKSIPLRFYINEWASIRNLIVLYKENFDEITKKFIKENKISYFPGGNLLGDFHNLNIALIGTKNQQFLTEELKQIYIDELEKYFFKEGRDKDEFIIVNLEIDNSYNQSLEFFPMFYILWIPEKPLWERMISGKDTSIEKKLKETNNFKKLKEVKQKFYTSAEKSNVKFKLKAISLSKENPLIIKHFIKKIEDRYVILFISTQKDFYSLNIFESIVNSFLYSDRPILKMEDYLKFHQISSYSISMVELKENGMWKAIFYQSSCFFYRKSKNKLYRLPDYARKRKYIHNSLFDNQDRLFIIPQILNLTNLEIQSPEKPEFSFLKSIKKSYTYKYYIILKE